MHDEQGLRELVVPMRCARMSRRQIRDELEIWNNDRLNRLLKGEPPPEWTKRPRAKDELRTKASRRQVVGGGRDRAVDGAGALHHRRGAVLVGGGEGQGVLPP